MLPKKASEFYKKTAKQLGISEDLVRDAVGMYWSDVRKALTDMQHHAIFIDKLGTFSAKEKRLKEALEKHERYDSLNKGDTYRKMAMKQEGQSRITKIKALLELIEKDKQKKQEVKNKRDGKLNTTNLEEQVVNPGGNSKQDIQETICGTDIPEENEDM